MANNDEHVHGNAIPGDVHQPNEGHQVGGLKVDESEQEEKQTCRESCRDYPLSVLCIIGNEFCERFSYYGMRAVLVLYLVNVLKYDRNSATALYSGFVMLNYFSPVLGSILADGYIGKFRTILWVSLLYAAGNVTIAVAATFEDRSVVHPWLDILGLIIIALGTGGIKPCVQTFGGDQFRKGQERQLRQFFSIFYFAINAGSTISILLTPIFRTKPCLGRTTCYPLAFGIPAALMVAAVIIFALGSFWYKKVPPEGNVFSKLAKVTVVSLKNKRLFDAKKHDHWLDHYMDNHSCKYDDECREKETCKKAQFVDDVKALLRVLIVYVPLPIFWALYDQQGSTWVLQGTQMNSQLAEGVYVLPDQMGVRWKVLNAVLIMILIPIFQFIIYPLLSKCFTLTPLRKMCAGGVIAGGAYVVCMLIQFSIRPTLPPLPNNGEALLNVVNYIQECDQLRVTAGNGDAPVLDVVLNRNESHSFRLPGDQLLEWNVSDNSNHCDWASSHQGIWSKSRLISGTSNYAVLAENVNEITLHRAETQKSESGTTVFTMNVNYYVDNPVDPVQVVLCKEANQWNQCSPKDAEKYSLFGIVSRTSSYADVKPGTWGIFVVQVGKTPSFIGQFAKKENGGIYTLTLFSSSGHSQKVLYSLLQLAPDNTVSILWQIPQYFVISVAEVLFSISGNEFAYSQAPLSMKAVVMALWLLTDSIGNVIILIISTVTSVTSDMSWIFLAYAGLMFAIMFIFVWIAYKYKYSDHVREDSNVNE